MTEETELVKTELVETKSVETKPVETELTEEELLERELAASALHARNANSRMIFKNHTLMSQFLKNYTGISIFDKIQPEDIKDVTPKFQAFLGVEFESDTVKRVRITTKEKDENTKEEIQEVYVIPLIDHKSRVEYDVAMQLFRYMAVIWYDYSRLYEREHRNKSFRYPLILPVIYYEGKDTWTADIHFEDRIRQIKGMEKYIPKFEYKVIACHGYTKEKLIEQHDEMSLIMLINRIQTPEDFHEFLKIPRDYVEEVVKNAPEEIRKIIGNVLWALLMKMGISVEEAREAVENMEAGQVGYLFENIEKMDIQEERRKTEEAIARANQAESRAKEEKDMISKIIHVAKAEKQKNHTKEETLELLKTQYHMGKEAEEWLDQIW